MHIFLGVETAQIVSRYPVCKESVVIDLGRRVSLVQYMFFEL